MACVEDKLEMDVDLTGPNDNNNASALQRRSAPVQNRHNLLPSCGTKTGRTKTSSRKSDGSVNDDGKIRKNTSRQVSECNLFHSCFEDDCMCNGNPVRGYSCVPNNEHAIFWRAKFCLRCTVRLRCIMYGPFGPTDSKSQTDLLRLIHCIATYLRFS